MKSFGERLKEARVGRKLSRNQVQRMTLDIVSEEAIKALELSTNQKPRNGTLAALVKIFPQLGINTPDNAVIGHLYPNASTKGMIPTK